MREVNNMNEERESSVNFEESTVTQKVMLPGQEKYIASVNHENREANKTVSLELDLESLQPINNNVIIKCKVRERSTGGIIYTSSDVNYDSKEIFKISKKVKENNPDVIPGKQCHVLMSVIRHLPEAKPCMKTTDSTGTYEYWKVSCEQIEYIYDLREVHKEK